MPALTPKFARASALAMVLLLAAGVAVAELPHLRWSQLGWENVEVTSIDFRYADGRRDASLEFDPTVVVFRNAGWNKAAVRHQFEAATRILSACGVRVGTATLVMADPPGGKIDVDMVDEPLLLKSTPVQSRPLFFLFRRTPLRDTGYSFFGRGCRLASCNTVWLASDVLTHSYQKRHQGDYNPTAHELVHVFAQMKHEEGLLEGNILDPQAVERTSAISAEQCNAIRESPLLKPVLVR